MFEPLDKSPSDVYLTFTFDGKSVLAKPGMNVATALLIAGITVLRNTPVSGAPRGPFCMMGACYDCLVLLDGATVQACLTLVKEGLVVTRVPIMNEVTE